MNQSAPVAPHRPAFLDDPRAFEGVLTRRVLASFVDLFAIGFLCTLVLLVTGVLTFGIGAILLVTLLPFAAIVSIIYVAVTMGGEANATWGMRAMGVRMERLDGGNVDPILAAVHSLLFWAQFTLFAPILLIGLFTDRRRLAHDILLGTVFVRADTRLR